MICGMEDPDFPARPDDDELLLEEFDMLELRPELETGLSVTVDAMLRSGTPVVELWLHQPDEAAMRARLTAHEARELASMLEGQAADVEDATPSVERCPACDGRGSSRPETSCSASAARATAGSRFQTPEDDCGLRSRLEAEKRPENPGLREREGQRSSALRGTCWVRERAFSDMRALKTSNRQQRQR